jgi:glutaredoxin 3
MSLTIYSKPGCSHCQKFIFIAQHQGLDYVVYELGEHFTKEEFYSEFGTSATFPQITLGDIPLGGCKESIQYLKEKELCCMI